MNFCFGQGLMNSRKQINIRLITKNTKSKILIISRDCFGKMKIGCNLITLGVNRDLFEFYLMSLSKEIDMKLCQRYTYQN